MRRVLLSLALALAGLLTGARAQSAPASDVTAVRAGHMLDVESGRLVEDAVILISNGRVTGAGPGLPVPPGAQVIDLGRGATLLPGLIDAHTHLLLDLDG